MASKNDDVANIKASLLKQYFRDLPDPLFTTNLYADFIACVPKGADSADINGISSIVRTRDLSIHVCVCVCACVCVYSMEYYILFWVLENSGGL